MAKRQYKRRSVLGLLAGSIAGVVAGCSDAEPTQLIKAEETEELEPLTPASARTAQLASDGPSDRPRPSSTPEPFRAGREARALLAGTPSETQLSIAHSGLTGASVMVLGGVHGNEPGGWLAARELAAVTPVTGSLIVLPEANRLAMEGFVRTYDELGDLNRLYPGNAESDQAMARMAAEIVAIAKEFRADVLLDLHESWGFYATRTQSGTAFLGQTISAGVGPRNPGFTSELIERVNPLISVERDLMVFRDGTPFRNPQTAPPDPSGNRGRSSLSLGGHVPGLTPLLIEMGQEDQPESRRVELHLLVAMEALKMLGVV